MKHYAPQAEFSPLVATGLPFSKGLVAPYSCSAIFISAMSNGSDSAVIPLGLDMQTKPDGQEACPALMGVAPPPILMGGPSLDLTVSQTEVSLYAGYGRRAALPHLRRGVIAHSYWRSWRTRRPARCIPQLADMYPILFLIKFSMFKRGGAGRPVLSSQLIKLIFFRFFDVFSENFLN
jgi:hypothetical protein